MIVQIILLPQATSFQRFLILATNLANLTNLTNFIQNLCEFEQICGSIKNILVQHHLKQIHLRYITHCIKKGFSFKEYQIYVNLQGTLAKAFKVQEWGFDLQLVKVVFQNYGLIKFDVPPLKTQLLFLPQIGKFYGLGPGQEMLMEEVVKLVNLIPVIAVTNAANILTF